MGCGASKSNVSPEEPLLGLHDHYFGTGRLKQLLGLAENVATVSGPATGKDHGGRAATPTTPPTGTPRKPDAPSTLGADVRLLSAQFLISAVRSSATHTVHPPPPHRAPSSVDND